MKLLWVIPELKGGIQTYSDALWPALKKSATQQGFEALEPVRYSHPDEARAIEMICAAKPDLVHIQHEFGLFGSKVPGLYKFPPMVQALRRVLPQTKFVATGHTILDEDFAYDWKGRGLRGIAQWTSNQTWVKLARPLWLRRTWGMLDGVIVHSEIQRGTVERAGCPEVHVIPHFVPELGPKRVGRETHPALGRLSESSPMVLVFGFFTPEKGQDLAIKAIARSRTRPMLILAGGVRRKEDQLYFEHCQRLIAELGVQDRVVTTGFLDPEWVDAFYARATLVLAPFRATTGSGSLTQAFARGSAILSSDLALNREIADRVPDALAFYRALDPRSCADQIDMLLSNTQAREKLSAGAHRYAELCAPPRVAELHQKFYQRVTSK